MSETRLTVMPSSLGGHCVTSDPVASVNCAVPLTPHGARLLRFLWSRLTMDTGRTIIAALLCSGPPLAFHLAGGSGIERTRHAPERLRPAVCEA